MLGPSNLLRLGNKLRRQPSNAPEGSPRSRSIRISICDSFRVDPPLGGKGRETLSTVNSGLECKGTQTHGDGWRVVKVYIPDEMGQGQKVKISGPGIRKVRAIIPPRAKWRFQNCGGEPRPYFLVLCIVDPDAAAPRRRHSTGSCRQAPVTEEDPPTNVGRRVSFQDASGTVCRCVLSEGVFDSFCPIHGTDSLRGRM